MHHQLVVALSGVARNLARALPPVHPELLPAHEHDSDLLGNDQVAVPLTAPIIRARLRASLSAG